MAVWVTGDIHGDPRRFSTDYFPEQKDMTKDDFVIILGDFGLIWSNTKEEEYWLDWLNNKPFTTLFIDGNHENFNLLYSYPVVDFHGGKAHRIRDNIYHLMRGYIFDICDKKFFAFGGARSHDINDGILDPNEYIDRPEDFKKLYNSMRRHNKLFRVKGVSWWEEELPSDEEMERGRQSLKGADNKVDFVLTHCAPQEICSLIGFRDKDKLTWYLNELIWNGLQFDRWLFGHYHYDKQLISKFILMYNNIIQIV